MDNKQEVRRVYRKRLTVELLPEEEAFVREIRSKAIAQGHTLRDWVLAAMREKVERDGRTS